MTRIVPPRTAVLFCLALAFSLVSQAQVAAGPSIADSTANQPVSTRTISFSGNVPGQLDGALSLTFAIYPDQQSSAALWSETQVVQIAGEKYTVMLGATSAAGLPQEIFATDQAHWLGVQANGAEKRFLLVSVPYAMKAVEAERLGGLLPSDFVTVAQLQSILQNSASQPAGSQPAAGKPAGVQPLAAPAGTPPQPATDFTDNNDSEVLLVTQQGTGFAIHAITSAAADGIFAETSSTGGTAMHGFASNQSGQGIGVLAETASPDGIAGEFNNRAGGKILSLRGNGAEVASFDASGNLTVAGQINGNGSGLTNIPPQAINATPINIPSTVVFRDSSGNFAANQITGGLFSGNGAGLFGIPPEGINATPINIPSTVVFRDSSGNFAANQITGGLFSGNGAGLFGIPPQGINATPINIPSTVVFRDSSGNFAANQITGGLFSGNGAGLFGIPPQAVSATPINVPNSVVARDASGNFLAGVIMAGGVNVTASGFVGIQASAVSGIGLWTGATATDNSGTALLLSHASLGKLIRGGVGTSTTLTNESFSLDAAGNVSFNGGMMTPYETTGPLLPNSLVKLTSDPGTSGAGTVAMTAPGDIAGAIGILTGLPSGSSKIQVAQSGQFSCNFDGPATPGHYVGISKTTAGDCADIGPSYPNDGQQIVGRVLSSSGPTATRILLFQSELHGSAGGTGSGVTSVGAGDASIAIGGTAAQPTIAVAAGGITSDKIAPNAVSSASIADGSLAPAKIAGTAATLGVNTFSGTQTMPAVNVGAVVASGNISASTVSSTGGGTFGGPTTVNTASGTALAVNGGDSTNPGLTVQNQALDGTALQGTSTGNTGIGVLGTATGGQSVAGMFVNAQGNGRIISGRVGPGTGSEVFSVDTAGNVFAGGAQVAQFSNSSSGTTQAGLAKIDANGFALNTAPGDTIGAVGIVVSNAGTFGPVRIAYGGTAFCVFDGLPHIQDYVQISRTTAGQCSDVGPNYPTSGQVIGRVTGVGGGTGAFVLLSGPSTQATKSGVLSITAGSGLSGGTITTSGTISIAPSGVSNLMLQNNTITIGDGPGIGGGGVVPLGGVVTISNLGALSFNGRVGNIIPSFGDYSFSQINGTASASQLPSSVVLNNQSNTFNGNQTINGALSTSGLVATGNSTPFSAVMAVADTSSQPGGQPALSTLSSNNPAAIFISNAPTILTVGSQTHAVLSVGGTGAVVTGSLTATSFAGDGSALSNISASKIGTLSQSDIATTTALNAETSARQTADTALSASVTAETTARQSDVANLQTSINNVSAADAKLAASNTFTAGTQDFSGATATLPVHAVLAANAPSSCVAGKELLIETDAPAGQQLFICNATANGWNPIGGGGVASFNGRSGSVTPISGDYSFGQISGSAAITQLPGTVVYSNQANNFSASQAVNGTVSATAFTGNGAALTGVNAASLNGLASGSFAQLNAANSFTAKQTLASSSASGASLNVPAGSAPSTPAAGDVWNTGAVLQYRDSASTTRSLVSTTQSGGLQLLKLTASITPSNVNSQVCTEQTFTVSGIATGDVILNVLQPSNNSPGSNIGIGSFRVSAANSVIISFCNVGKNNSTPTSGVYTFALMR